MDRHRKLQTAEARIQRHRTAPVELHFVGPDGEAAVGADCEIRLVRHEFKLGANAFGLGRHDDPGLQREYETRFAALLNYATLPFYWRSHEPEMDRREEAAVDAMVEWCGWRHMAAKGHPLVWHETFPRWAEALTDAEVLAKLEARVWHLVEKYAGQIDAWDVVNEATVSHRFDNAIGRWMRETGAAECVDRAFEWAHGANPRATLLYNDYNVSERYEELAASLVRRHTPLHALGIQSHMHKRLWPLDKVWATCEAYARFGLPLHFTELTVLSGRLKAPDDNDWHRACTDWFTTPEGEQTQLKYGSAFYTLAFSHPAVEAVTWWDLSDARSWQGAPAGLVRADMTPKPLYEWLLDAFGKRWTTRVRQTASAAGQVHIRAFFGDYEVAAKTASGRTLRGAFTLARRGVRRIEVKLAEAVEG